MGLDGEAGLAMRHYFLRGVGVLDDLVAGIAGHHRGLNRSLSALADPDHFGDPNEMILHPLAAVETCGAGRLDDGLEVPIIRIAEDCGEVATHWSRM